MLELVFLASARNIWSRILYLGSKWDRFRDFIFLEPRSLFAALEPFRSLGASFGVVHKVRRSEPKRPKRSQAAGRNQPNNSFSLSDSLWNWMPTTVLSAYAVSAYIPRNKDTWLLISISDYVSLFLYFSVLLITICQLAHKDIYIYIYIYNNNDDKNMYI